MDKEQRVIKELESATNEWEGDFIFDVELDEAEWGSWHYFSVNITHRFIESADHNFTVRANDTDVEIDMADDCWCPLTKGDLFALMWFESNL